MKTSRFNRNRRFFLLDVQTQEEAEYWASRCPDPQGNGEGEIELRPLY